MEYMKVAQAAEQWGISDRRVRILCQQRKIEGVIQKGRSYLIPACAVKPVDGRTLRHKGISEQYLPLFSRIDSLKEQLDQRRPLTSGELQRMQEEFLVEYTYNSNAIEGNTLTLQETALVLEGVTIDRKPLKDHLEAVGHKDAFLYVQELVKDRVPFSESIIKQIHTLVLMDSPDDRGIYRRIPVRIMGAYHTPPEPILVPEQMEKLIAELSKKKLHPIENAALFHLKFEGVHPFIDGNLSEAFDKFPYGKQIVMESKNEKQGLYRLCFFFTFHNNYVTQDLKEANAYEKIRFKSRIHLRFMLSINHAFRINRHDATNHLQLQNSSSEGSALCCRKR